MNVGLRVEDDRSGGVSVVVTLDDEALARVPDLDLDADSDVDDLRSLLRTSDLAAAGWELDGPTATSGDGAAVSLRKGFGTLEEAEAVLDELAGRDGAFGGLELEGRETFGRNEVELSGSIDMSGGLEAFGDAGLAAALDGEPLGLDESDIEAQLGRPLSEAFTLRFGASLPGKLEEPQVAVPSGEVSWQPVLGQDPIPVRALAVVERSGPWIAVAVAGVGGAGLVLLTLGGLWRWRRRRRAGRAGLSGFSPAHLEK